MLFLVDSWHRKILHRSIPAWFVRERQFAASPETGSAFSGIAQAESGELWRGVQQRRTTRSITEARGRGAISESVRDGRGAEDGISTELRISSSEFARRVCVWPAKA